MNKIFEYRSKKNLMQNELADKVGVSRISVINWEKGKSIPRTKEITAMCDIFGCYPIELMGKDSSVFCNYVPKDKKDIDIFLDTLRRDLNEKIR